METFSEIFNIESKAVEFVDITLDSDNEYYIDPNKLNEVDTELFNASLALNKVRSYFEEAFTLYVSGNEKKAIDLLSNPKEINAVRFGLSEGVPKGNGTSRDLLHDFFEKITSSEILKDLFSGSYTTFPLFVPRFGPDRFSDLISNIISKELAEFTFNICKKYNIETKIINLCKYYDVNTKEWLTLEVSLPIDNNDNPILLVPTQLAVEKNDYSASDFVQRILLVFLQNKHMEERTPSLIRFKFSKSENKEVPIEPTKEMVREYEINEKYTSPNKEKKFALDMVESYPQLLQQYLDTKEIEEAEL